jgi:hypothetical protein
MSAAKIASRSSDHDGGSDSKRPFVPYCQGQLETRLTPATRPLARVIQHRSMGQGGAGTPIERIGQIKNAVGIPLTLHGGSGTDDGDLRKAIAAGINIVHIGRRSSETLSSTTFALCEIRLLNVEIHLPNPAAV